MGDPRHSAHVQSHDLGQKRIPVNVPVVPDTRTILVDAKTDETFEQLRKLMAGFQELDRSGTRRSGKFSKDKIPQRLISREP